ncbi:MAG: PKD domain-containing protein, partial [Dehalococcoidia bacterium]
MKRTIISILGVLVLLTMLLGTAIPAMASQTVNWVTLDGGSSVTVAPGATITVVMNVTTSGSGSSNDWESSGWQIGSSGYTCVDTPDHTYPEGTYTESFTITAPMTEGTYDADFRAYRDGGCGGTYGELTLTDAVTVSSGGGPSSDCIGWQSPTNNSGSFGNPTAAYADGGNWWQQTTASNGQTHQYYGYDLSAIPTGATIEGITVRLDALVWGFGSPTGSLAVELSWDDGSSWTSTSYGTGALTGSEATYTCGGSSDDWGHTWALAELDDLRVGLTATTNGTVYLDWIPVEVCYTSGPATYTLTVNVDPSGSGNVSKTPDQATYAADTPVQLQAFPNVDWAFDEWTGDLTGSTNPDTIIMNSDKTVTAHFIPDCSGLEVQLAVILDGSSSITPDDWTTMVTGLSNAITNCMPHDGTVELTVIQFGGMSTYSAQVEIEPTIITAANYASVAADILAITQMTGYTPLACGITLAADTMAASPCYNIEGRQVINVVTDGLPNICCGAGAYTGTSCCPGTDTCTDAQNSAIAARTYAIGLGVDEIDVEFISTGTDGSEWLRDNIIYPATGYMYPDDPPTTWPPTGPGWVRVITSYGDFAEAICEKFVMITEECRLSITTDPANGAQIYIYNTSLSTWVSNGTAIDSFNELIDCGYCYEVWVVKDGWTYLVKSLTGRAGPSHENWSGLDTETAAGCTVEGQYNIHFEGTQCLPPEADFEATPTSGCDIPLSVDFTDLSTGDPTSWDWDFGDSSAHSDQQNPTHEYTAAGTYTVTLIATNDCGSDTETKTDYITITQCDDCEKCEGGVCVDDPTKDPTADFSGTPTSGCD